MLDIMFGSPSPPAKADGRDIQIVRGPAGETPYIGENGNWWVGEKDTGTLAGAGDHENLHGRDKHNQHPIDAIEGLLEAVESIPVAMTADELRKILLNGGIKNA